MKGVETIKDLIDEAKLRTVWWALCIFVVTYFLSHTSKSMWMNVPIAIFIVSMLRILCNEFNFSRKITPVWKQTYLSHLAKKQLSKDDPRLSTKPPPQKWKKKIDSPIVEAAMHEFVDKVLKDFVLDLWYSDITSDKEVPKLIHSVIMDALAEIAARVKEINLVDLLTKDIIDLVGDHLDLYRRNQAAIGVDVMATLSTAEKDERLKYHLMASKELHPALISSESEYKVLQQLVSGVLAVVLKPREAQCPLVRSIARELVTSLVLQPVLNLASPGYINELIETLLLVLTAGKAEEVGGGLSNTTSVYDHGHPVSSCGTHDQMETYLDSLTTFEEDFTQTRNSDWASMLKAATQRRTEVLAPENLENLWTKGKNYKKRDQKKLKAGQQEAIPKSSSVDSIISCEILRSESLSMSHGHSTGVEKKVAPLPPIGLESQIKNGIANKTHFSQDHYNASSFQKGTCDFSMEGDASRLKRSSSTSDLKSQHDTGKALTGVRTGPIIPDFFSPNYNARSEGSSAGSASNIMLRNERHHLPKLRCRVMGAYFEKLSSKSFAVYLIAVTDAENRTWFVTRRYSNFEKLHRYLKHIPNYTLHLPPKRIFSSSTEDAFVHQRCIQLNRYLQDVLSIANVAEQHEVWDFLSASSKNYSFGKSSSVMRTLAVNVDDAVDDIAHQFKGVSDGLVHKATGPTSPPREAIPSAPSRSLSWHAQDSNRQIFGQSAPESISSFSDNEDGDKDGNFGCPEYKSDTQTAWLENELNSPPEWAPPHVSVPLLNLVDKVFQLKRRGWIRRQVFWISKQILQLVMDDAIDDWILRHIHWLRKEDTIALGIRWLQDILWPGGIFFVKLRNAQSKGEKTETSRKPIQIASQLTSIKVSNPGSFEEQLEAARRASDVKKMIYDGAPTALVSLIGKRQYKRCARDIYNFIQSNVCVKQLTYSALELILISVFPELQSLVISVHTKLHVQQSV